MRYFLGIYDAAGYLDKLSKGLRENGNEVRYLNLAFDQYKYSRTNSYWLAKKIEILALQSSRNGIKRRMLTIIVGLSRWIVFLNEIPRSDVFVFTGFQSFFNFYELPILRLLKKTVIVVYLGSDARPPYLSGKHLDDNNEIFLNEKILQESKKLKSRIERVENWSTYIVNHAGTSQFFKRKLIHFSYLGIPFEANSLISFSIETRESKKIRILHAPSRPKAKGSETFRKIVENLIKEGFDLELVELKNRTNVEVLEEIQRCDLVLDELFSDTPLATLGIEASLYKKPLIVGGYFSLIVSDVLPAELLSPTLFVHPDKIERALRDLLLRSEEWPAIGEKQWQYVMNNYAPSKVANRLELIASGNFSSEYLYSPQDVTYINGWGISENNLKKQVFNYVNELGGDALLLNNNKVLKEKLLNFAGIRL
jgi:hypothetical protein